MNRNRNLFQWALIACLVGLAAPLSSCVNLWSVVESPSGDEQLLSKARACFDEGDLECAREYYNKLSSSYASIRDSELAYTTLDENGAGMKIFITAFGKGGGGIGVTQLADNISKLGGSTTRRGAIFSAFKAGVGISDTNISALVRFVAGIALVAELLAESSGSNGLLEKADLTATPSGCGAPCGADADCNPGIGTLADNDSGTPANLQTATVAQVEAATLDLGLFNRAIGEVTTALNAIGASGNFNTGILNFAAQFGALATGAGVGAQTYRCTLITNGVGN